MILQEALFDVAWSFIAYFPNGSARSLAHAQIVRLAVDLLPHQHAVSLLRRSTYSRAAQSGLQEGLCAIDGVRRICSLSFTIIVTLDLGAWGSKTENPLTTREVRDASSSRSASYYSALISANIFERGLSKKIRQAV